MQIKYFIYSLVTVCICMFEKAGAQDKFFTKTGKIEFVALQDKDVYAINRAAVVTFDIKTGEFQFSVLINGFEFKKAFMQEKFNHQIMEADKFPKAIFKGNVDNQSQVNYQKDGDYPVQVKGKLTMHGITKDIMAKGVLSVSKGKITATSTFNLSIDDYNISNPGIGDGNMAISVDCSLDLMKN